MVSIVQALYEQIGLAVPATLGDVLGLSSVLFLLIASLSQFTFSSKQIEEKAPQLDRPQDGELLGEKAQEKEVAAPIVGWSERLKKGLSSSRTQVWGKISGLMSGASLSDEDLEAIEELLYSSDIGPAAASSLTQALEEKAKDKNFTAEQFKPFLKDFLKEQFAATQGQVDEDLFTAHGNEATKVVMIVGVNGAGKTTTIGKLATKLTAQGASVVVGACDTFRAAAVDQLQVWCDRAGATMIRAKEGAGPSGVGYEALEKALAMKADYCLLDTAGRLHTKENLMDELAKSKKVLGKLDANAPHQVLLVIDAITGQNAIRQAEEFHKTLGLTGLILTKCDGSSKAGSAVSIVQSLKLPITYIGVGESVEDINRFDVDEYVNALLDL